ncbi:MAG: hypothetical protein HKN43_00190 [Rhodothermales bacterium]|nr:hypothetical protein [Rhodothermales bacterium]
MKTIMQFSGIAVVALVLIGYAGFPTASEVTTSSDRPVTVESFGRAHTIIGDAASTFSDNRFTVTGSHSEAEFGVAIEFEAGETLNLHFDPIRIENGGTLNANLYDNVGQKLITVNHFQRTHNQTDINVEMSALMPHLTSNDLEVTTYFDGVATHSEAIEARSNVNLGTVTTTDDDDEWVKTWHVVCVDGDCELFADPDNTVFEYAGSSDRKYPFEYIGIGFKSDASLDAGLLELVGNGVDNITIHNENSDPLNLVNKFALQ